MNKFSLLYTKISFIINIYFLQFIYIFLTLIQHKETELDVMIYEF